LAPVAAVETVNVPDVVNVCILKLPSYVTVPPVAAITGDATVVLIVLVAVFPVDAAVAVSSEVTLPAVVGVPVMFAPTILNPAGSAFAVYVIDLPAALVALNA
jgi:hypothetical protein